MTRIPRVRLSATFSAAWRHTVHVRNRLSPSFHSFVLLSRYRGVLATRNLATGWPAGVKRNSGSSVKLPTRVIWASFMILTFLLCWVFGSAAWFAALVFAVGDRWRLARHRYCLRCGLQGTGTEKYTQEEKQSFV